MFDRMNIPRRLGFAFVALNVTAALMMVVFGISLAMVSNVSARNTESQAVLADTLALETALLRQNSQFRGFLVTADESYLKSYHEGRDDYDKTSAALEARLTEPELQDLVRRSRTETLKWRESWGDRYIAVVKAGQRDAAQEAVRAAGKAVLVSDAVLPLRAVKDAKTKEITEETARQESAILFAWIALAIGGATLIGLALVLSRRLSRSIAVPLSDLTETMTALADGQNDAPIPGTSRADELGDMARAVMVFRDAALDRARAVADRERAMAQIGERLSAVAQADLSVRIIGVPPAFQTVADDFNEAMERLCQAMGLVQDSIVAINLTSSEIQQATTDLATRSEQQAASLQASSSAMEHLTTQIEDYAKIAAQVSGSMVEARGEAENGGMVVSKAIEAMDNVERASAEISEITAMIDGIAFQTNLLALNAGVEAARAGEAGKGFAVVASEVRALAQRATEAANAIKQRVEAVTSHVRSGVSLVNETGSALETIISRVSAVTSSISTIAETAGEQSIALRKINGAIGAMDQMTQQNAAMVEETNAATKNLSEQAGQLASAFSSFRIGGEKRRLPTPVLARVPTVAPSRVRATTPAPSVPLATGNLAIDNDWSEF
ncbi:methyl-accepting chemotaxis protein [Novosphingobium subterraneum]|uniref:Methyl-accepting chemotaxis sensory transducer n=1 Tax=Novosphingobium subterraneum TaxID=48936 RepID=A0A0B9A0A2_9SPHN|nr:methyl-accepting chemotaxis protein [Novosphingobium subterraneum]KHS48779.1 methyl-accepting chemotaxis sensory transducer [Novosphingobium subterraneum]